MKKVNFEMKRINRNITNLNIINLVGLIAFLRSRTVNDKANVLLKICNILAAIALMLNGICIVSDELEYMK